MAGSKWQQHLDCCRIIRQHRDWTDKQVMEEAGLRSLEINVVQEARREVDCEHLASDVQSQRSY